MRSNFVLLLVTSLFISWLSIFTICDANLVGEVEAANQHPFSYILATSNGPSNWGLINSSWALCGNGKFQSPIDIDIKRVQIENSLGKLRRAYKPAPAKIYNRGHDIIVEWQRDAGQMEINGTSYKLVQCHWHSPSEHTINGKKFDMESHMVHVSDGGQKAVLSVLYSFGEPDPFLGNLTEHIKIVGKTGIDLGIVDPRGIRSGSKKYFRYIGSLTSPPCSEGVIWTISDKIRTVSKEQVTLTKDALHDGFQDNARPTQPLHGRQVLQYNSFLKGSS